MSIKIIATDLDGTLMSPDHQTVSGRTIKALEEAKSKGIKLAIATGRPLALIDNVIKQVPFIDYIIYSNGACVFDRNQNKIIYSNLISNEISKDLIGWFLDRPVFFEVYIDGKSHYQQNTQGKLQKLDLPRDFLDEVISTMQPHESLIDFLADREIEKLTAYGVADEDMEYYSSKPAALNLSIASSFDGNIEATAPNTDKGEALKGLCASLGITADEVMAFGDGGNDAPMLRFAEHSFAMQNGSAECKASAKHIALSNAEDGVSKEVEKILKLLK